MNITTCKTQMDLKNIIIDFQKTGKHMNKNEKGDKIKQTANT